MSRRRPVSSPPPIDGYEFLSVVGSGGFADVFLYQQLRPRRRVAVKVLLHGVASAAARTAFDHEADLMATLSTHPSIVTIYEVGVSSDGRPFLAMEYCSRPSLDHRMRTERLSVAEALRVTVQVAGAVETAHRAGILHRDIKPANILVTDYNHPALTDFGISSQAVGGSQSEGMSIPWSPPESFDEPPVSTVQTDVWALGGTLYSLLTTRSPFEVPGGPNSGADIIARIIASPLAPTGRSDVPGSLERVLATAMAKQPANRYPTVLEFARALQRVQLELSLEPTPIDLLDQHGAVLNDDDPDDGTQMHELRPSGGAAGPQHRTAPPGVGAVVQDDGQWTTQAPLPPSMTGAAPAAAAPSAPAGQSRPVSHAERAWGDPAAMASVADTVLPGRAPTPADQHPAQPAVATPPWPTGGVTPVGPAAPTAPVGVGVPTPPSAPAAAAAWYEAPLDATVGRPLVTPPSEQAPSDPAAAQQPASGARGRRGLVIGGAAAAIVLVAAGVVVAMNLAGGSDQPSRVTVDPSASSDGGGTEGEPPGGDVPGGELVADVAAPTDVVLDLAAVPATASWTPVDPADGDLYRWRVIRLGSDGTWSVPAAETSATLGEVTGEICVEVQAIRSGHASESVQGCTGGAG